jgi:16S rRNA C1402 N4-methylase RsmH
MRGRIFLVEGETSKAFCCFSDACIISLQHGRKIHNAIVNEVLNILRSLVNEGEKKTARQLANHLVKTWKEQGHDETTQFTELVENEVRDARSETS